MLDGQRRWPFSRGARSAHDRSPLLADPDSWAERPLASHGRALAVARDRLNPLSTAIPLVAESSPAPADVPGRLEAVEVIESLQRALVKENPLGVKYQQLVHFGQLVVLGHRDAASCRAATARRAGATPRELIGVVETALITAGMPAYNLGITVLTALFEEIPGRGLADGHPEGHNP